MRPLFSLSPLLLAAGILLAGNGLQGTLIALRSDVEGFSAALTGLMGTGYFLGFMLSSLIAPKMVRAVGHIRVFSALAAMASAATLGFVLWINPYGWIGLRFVSGFCFAGLFMTVESWLNQSIGNDARGRLLSVYRLVDLGFVTGGQLLLPVIGIEGFAIFAFTAIVLSLSAVPVSLADRTSPMPPKSARFNLAEVWKISPIACLGCITIGLTNSSFRLVGPLYASRLGFDTAAVAFFMAMGIVGGAVLQYPLGWLSDRYDRRWVLIGATTGAALAGQFLAHYAASGAVYAYGGAFAFGAFSLPLYSLSAAHANDRAGKEQYVMLAAGLMFFFSGGAALGPALAAWFLENRGTPAFFTYISAMHGLLIFLTLWRMSVKPKPAKTARGRFMALMRTSPVLLRMARAASGNTKTAHKRKRGN